MINSNNISTEFKEKIRNSVPEDFDLAQIGRIDLKEAEQIAGEAVVFLTEEDLIEGLEDFELIPLKEDETVSAEIIPDEQTGLEKEVVGDVHKDVIPEKVEEEILLFDDIYPEKDIKEKHQAAGENHITEISEFDEAAANINEPEITVHAEEHDIETESIPAGPGAEIVPELSDLTEDMQEYKTETDTVLEKEDHTPGQPDLDEYYQHIPDINEIDEIFENEELPDKYVEIHKKGNVNFIDDRHISKQVDFGIASEDDPLISRLSKMIEIARGESIVIESDPDFYKERYILEDQKVYEYYDDVFYEEKFITDTDFDFIDNSIIKEDFIHYIQEIDEYYSTEAQYSQSEISEIMGFAKDEDKFFEEHLFGEYFKNIDMDSEIEFINPELDFFSRTISDNKKLIYLLDDPESLKEDEKISIEADISSDSAIVFEENVKDIESMLGEAPEKISIEKEYSEKISPAKNEPEKVVFEDITDKVIILDDLDNINEFVETMPEKKEDMTRLLAYLDGLFEKLPEDAVRKFAESEYFDLYAKVLKEMGV